MLKKRDKPLMTWDELFKLNGIKFTYSPDNKSHIFIKDGNSTFELDEETFNQLNPFTDEYLILKEEVKN